MSRNAPSKGCKPAGVVRANRAALPLDGALSVVSSDVAPPGAARPKPAKAKESARSRT